MSLVAMKIAALPIALAWGGLAWNLGRKQAVLASIPPDLNTEQYSGDAEVNG